ncbi:hypothetical protein RHSIM_Rhsim03G0041900 [Rhododendron simsii]|uniref:Uncharacterized protein n=1 Tax=Rhododendron simsii TaxID=118357 RepID=A0A834LTJ9_RHOSS|nr:hypothetical protein RHSIM_Rhsim03G0041900 [Rhododendron simsii]
MVISLWWILANSSIAVNIETEKASSCFVGAYHVLIVHRARKEAATGEVVIRDLSASFRLFRLKEAQFFGLRENWTSSVNHYVGNLFVFRTYFLHRKIM